MKRHQFFKWALLIHCLLLLALSACARTPTPITTTETPAPTGERPITTAVPPTLTPASQGRILLVTSAADSGPGTLRQAMQDAKSGDAIHFDPAVFPPHAPGNTPIGATR